MEPNLPDQGLLAAARAIDVAYTAARMAIIRRNANNLLGVEFKDFGGPHAFLAQRLPSELFNRAVGFSDHHVEEAKVVLQWFKEYEVSGRFDLFPGAEMATISELLAERGFRHTGFHATLFGRPEAPGPDTPTVDVAEVGFAAQMEEFLTAYLTGWEFPNEIWEGAKSNMRGWLGAPGWKLYIAKCDGRPAGAATLFLHERSGYLADATTAPEFQRAWRSGCIDQASPPRCACCRCPPDFGQASFLSTSHRNMMRNGMQLLCTQALWRERLLTR